MRSYQTLSVVAGILGIIIVFSVYVVLGTIESLSESFGGGFVIEENLISQIVISIFLYIIVIIIPFVIKKTKPLGYILIGVGVVTFFSAGYFGILGFAILIAAGIAAVRWKEKAVSSEKSSLDVLKERYAKGEISKEEFESMKKDLE